MNKIDLVFRKIMWLLWIYLAAALPFKWIYLAGDTPSTDSMGPVGLFMGSMYFGSLLITLVLRWVVIPRIPVFPLTIIPFFIGVIVAVSISFYGIFLFDEYLSVFFITSCLALLQFIPIFGIKKANKVVEATA
jgi:hypothetical protein